MTIGIYVLNFTGTDKVYVGQSVNIERRYLKHVSNLKLEKDRLDGNVKNIKLFNAYCKYGEPSLSILEVCPLIELDTKEISWIEEFDSVDFGYNICSGGRSGRGVHNGSSIYTESQILGAFELLLDSANLYSDISLKVGIPTSCISGIATGQIHMWLQDKYPDRYEIMLSTLSIRQKLSNELGHKKIHAKELGIVYPIVIDTDGIEYSITCIREFASVHGIDGGNLIKMLDGKYLKCGKFSLKNKEDKIIRTNKCYGTLISPNNSISEPIFNIKEFSEINGLCPSSIGKVLRGARASYKGWKLYKETT